MVIVGDVCDGRKEGRREDKQERGLGGGHDTSREYFILFQPYLRFNYAQNAL